MVGAQEVQHQEELLATTKEDMTKQIENATEENAGLRAEIAIMEEARSKVRPRTCMRQGAGGMHNALQAFFLWHFQQEKVATLVSDGFDSWMGMFFFGLGVKGG